MSDTNSFSATRHEKYSGDFAEKTAFERYGLKTSEKPICLISPALPRPGLARSVHLGRIMGICIQVQR